MDYNDYMMLSSAVNSFNNSLTNAANVYMASQMSSEDRAFSKQMTEKAWQHNIDLWKMQNEYNLPTNQYARQLEGLIANGLNPNLVYGSSSNVTGAASAPSSMPFQGYHSTAVPQFGKVQGLESFLNTRLLQTQIEAQEANVRLINARADNEHARTPGYYAKSSEAAYRWNYIMSDIRDNYDASVRANLAKDYWLGNKAEYDAQSSKYTSEIKYYQAGMAEWLNTTKVPGTDFTYQQYFERYKSMLPARTYEKMKYESLNLASMIAYRKKQGELVDLKKEYQRYVNHFAEMGRTLGSDWLSVLFNGIIDALGGYGHVTEGVQNFVDDPVGTSYNAEKNLILRIGKSARKWFKSL